MICDFVDFAETVKDITNFSRSGSPIILVSFEPV